MTPSAPRRAAALRRVRFNPRLKFGEEEVSVHFYIAVALGIGFTMLLTSALMGLVFLSSGTGHDESVEDPLRKDD